MGAISTQGNGISGESLYLAVPIKPNPTNVVRGIDVLDGEVFGCPAPENIDFLRAYVKEGPDFSEVVITASRAPFFDPRLYRLDGTNLEDKTTFHLSLAGNSQSQKESLKSAVLERFPGYIDLPLQPEFEAKLREAHPTIIQNLGMQRPFFDTHTKMIALLNGVDQLPVKRVIRGSLTNLARSVLSPYGINEFERNSELRLVMRHCGYYQGEPLEVAGIYLGGNRIEPAILGTVIMKQHKDPCPCLDEKKCDQAEFLAGYLFNVRQMFYAANRRLPELAKQFYVDQESGPVRRTDFCISGFQTVNTADGINPEQFDLEVLGEKGFNYGQILDMREIAGLAYQAL